MVMEAKTAARRHAGGGTPRTISSATKQSLRDSTSEGDLSSCDVDDSSSAKSKVAASEKLRKDHAPIQPYNPFRDVTAMGILAIALVSYFTMPPSFELVARPTVLQVWYYGWITALSTGLGVLPLLFVPAMDGWWIGVSNAIAGGMMIAASYSLCKEGVEFTDDLLPSDASSIPPSSLPLFGLARTAGGVLSGLLFIVVTKAFLHKYEDLKVGGILDGADARRVLLIIFVMIMHSFSEGVGIGVSFGGVDRRLGLFISASLAVHNVPEGLAVAIVLLPKRLRKTTVALWCVVTSLPQPLMAVPSFMFVEHFMPLLPVGLGFAGGAMFFVAVFELLVEAAAETGKATAFIISAASFIAMKVVQESIKE